MSVVLRRARVASFACYARASCRQRSGAADLLAEAARRRTALVADLVPPKRPSQDPLAEGPRLRWGRGPLGSVARAARDQREAEEAEVAYRIQRSIGKAPIGLYPVYDIPRQVALDFTGTKVLQPASLQHTLAEASRSVKWSSSGDGAALLSGSHAAQIEAPEFEQDEEEGDGVEWEEEEPEEPQ